MLDLRCDNSGHLPADLCSDATIPAIAKAGLLEIVVRSLMHHLAVVQSSHTVAYILTKLISEQDLTVDPHRERSCERGDAQRL